MAKTIKLVGLAAAACLFGLQARADASALGELKKDASDQRSSLQAPRAVAVAASPRERTTPQAFEGHAKFTGSSFSEFNYVEQLGVRRAAEMDAVAKCGVLNCAAIGSEITSCNDIEGSFFHQKKECSATAVAINYGKTKASAMKSFNGIARAETKNNTPLSDLELLGLQKMAQEHVVIECRKQGFGHCIAIEGGTTGCSNNECSATATAIGF